MALLTRGEAEAAVQAFQADWDYLIRLQVTEALVRRAASLAWEQALRGFDAVQAEALRALLHQSPRGFGKETSLWTLELAAEVSFEQGLTRQRVSREAVRTALQRLGVRWKRAKQWITSPDQAYVRKKGTATD